MSELAAVRNQVVAQVSTEQVELIKRTVAKGATDDELQMFLHLAQKYNLDPFAKEIWFIKYDGKAPTIMTSRDGYLKIAQGHEAYEGLISFSVYEGDAFEIDATNYTVTHKFGVKRGEIIGAWARCDRKGCKPQLAFVPFDEYDQGNQIWKRYKSAMIQKVAETFVLKRQFGISGLTTKEEMPEEYDLKNVSEHQVSSTAHPVADDSPQISQNVGDYEVSINNSPRIKLSDMTMKQLKWLAQSAKSETTQAMAAAYIDEIEFKEKEIEAEPQETTGENLATADLQADEVHEDNPAALFGGAAL